MSDTSSGRSATPPPIDPILTSLGWTGRWQALVAEALDGTPGRLVRHDGHAALVWSQDAVTSLPIRPSVPDLAVGDWVIVADGRIVDLLPRSSLLQRRDPSTGLGQPIAANVDIVGIVCGLDRPVRTGRISRFVALAWHAGASPLVILTKADLQADLGAIEDEILASAPGCEVISVSAQEATGLADLLERCSGKTLVLVGESGAGKSTLVNALVGRMGAATGSVRGGDHKGRHTTTSRQLYVLPNDCRLIDTPGMREVGLATDAETIEQGFDDIAVLAENCRFRDCEHDAEPGCAVRAAIELGDLPESRLRRWAEFREEARGAELRADVAARRKEDRRKGRIVHEAQRLKRGRRTR